MKIEELIKQSGLTVAEVAGICGVTRVAVHTWIKGGNINPLRKPRVDKLFAAVESAIKAGDLPPKVGSRQKDVLAIEERKNQVKQAIVKHLRTQTPSA